MSPETTKKLHDLATRSRRTPEDIVEDALAGYLDEVASVRKRLDSRYDDRKSGQLKPRHRNASTSCLPASLHLDRRALFAATSEVGRT